MSSALVIMTRSTSDPRIKTRLAPRIPSAAGRRDLALGFIDDLVDRWRALPGVSLRLAVTPPVEGLRFDRPSLNADTFLVQRGTKIAERQRHVFDDLAASGFTQIVMVGSDTPDVPLEYLQEAFALLSREPSGVVVGPSDNGSCYLIGMTVRPGAVPDLFSAVRWGTPHTMDDLAQASSQLGLPSHRLEPWNDVDAPDDLNQLAARLRYAPSTAPYTLSVLRRLGLV